LQGAEKAKRNRGLRENSLRDIFEVEQQQQLSPKATNPVMDTPIYGEELYSSK
jgi:hypothetical protein